MGGSRRDADGGAVPVRADIPAAPLIGATELERGRDEYLAHLSLERNLSVNTVAGYRRDLDAYIAFLLR